VTTHRKLFDTCQRGVQGSSLVWVSIQKGNCLAPHHHELWSNEVYCFLRSSLHVIGLCIFLFLGPASLCPSGLNSGHQLEFYITFTVLEDSRLCAAPWRNRQTVVAEPEGLTPPVPLETTTQPFTLKLDLMASSCLLLGLPRHFSTKFLYGFLVSPALVTLPAVTTLIVPSSSYYPALLISSFSSTNFHGHFLFTHF
jgi:hypothetical protein